MAWDTKYVKTLEEHIKVGEERIAQLESFLITKTGWTEDQLVKIKYELEDMKNIIKTDKGHLEFVLKTKGGIYEFR